MSSIVVAGDTSGSITLQEHNTVFCNMFSEGKY